MPSTYSSSLLLELQANGENSNSWGTLLNAVLDQIDTAIGGYLSLSVAGSADVTLSATQALNQILEFTGILTGNISVIVPAREKPFLIYNNTTGAFTLTVKTAAGTGIAVLRGERAVLYCDATNVLRFTHGLDEQGLEGADLASATTTNIWQEAGTQHITGTTTITSLGTAPRAGACKKIIFDGALTLTHGTNLNLPGSANITTAADDWAIVYADTTTQLDVIAYFKKNGQAVTASSVPVAAGAGTVDAITADFTPNVTLDDNVLVCVISAGNNSSSTPTFAPDGLTAKTIKARGHQALTAGDTGPAGNPLLLKRDAGAADCWELINPARLSVTFLNSGTIGGLGFSATDTNSGTKSSGTFTPDPAIGNFQYAVNGGAHTLAPPATSCTMIIQYTNDGSAGAITTSGFTKVTGSFTTVNGDDFMCYITRLNGFSTLNIVALQ